MLRATPRSPGVERCLRRLGEILPTAGGEETEIAMHDGLPALRHSARGCLNSIKLCASAMELPCTPEEEMEFIDDIIRSSGKMIELLDSISQAFDAQAAPQTSPSP